ncbi:GGDEF domain-containing protein [Marispirochaeta sp.]|jgi:diguanylate cyclase (GGDEF)-like protein|uniref:GGDEF domain-containing protein n=1 Tax=Marispirochaeta sp. TaxID=2038653 RepID=UPI0029C7D16A|nr:GGDEF domain-containing protein [Marispirochaeta sp.]
MNMKNIRYYIETEKQRYRLQPGESYTIGRNPDQDIFLSDPTVSRTHARIVWENNSFGIRDTGSTNGVFLNGEAIHTARLSDRDSLKLGKIKLYYSETRDHAEDTLSPDDSILIEHRMQDLINRVKDPGLKARFGELIGLFSAKKRNLSDLAYHDTLTGLLNRRSFDKNIVTEWRRRSRYQRPLSLIMIDIDHFKKINDRYGHQKGDAVLKTVAAIIHDNVRYSDYPCRYGGEELVVILPETTLQSALVTAEKLRSLVEKQVLEIEAITVTISLGVGAYDHTMKKPEDLVATADRAMYKAKKEGRNRVAG